ncbi:MAG: hypothetical protein GXY38_04595 [Planctomycetes bacterium]|jgi:D-glycero-alpha-D-manno-heptose-7-phosphate kinase|nr:hypothetical protein [Planctomycetota bacterium]
MNHDIFEVEITSQAPARISLAGGGTDISPYPEEFGGEVVNATISIFMLARLRLRPEAEVIIHANTRSDPMSYPSFDAMKFDGRLDFIKAAARALYNRDHGFELYVYSSLPMRSGLGGSGAMCVAVLEAFNELSAGRRLNQYELAELAYKIETDQLQNASGRQDQYASAFGGFNHFEFFGGNHVRVSRIDIGRAQERVLNQAIVLFWIGERTASGRIIEDQTLGVRDGGTVLEAMHATRATVGDMHDALNDMDVQRIGELLHDLWSIKKKFSRHVSNDRIDDIYRRLQNAGMIGGKITGAGGGGHLLACCHIEKRDDVLAQGEALGLRNVPFTFVSGGVLSWRSPLRIIRPATRLIMPPIAPGAFAQIPRAS